MPPSACLSPPFCFGVHRWNWSSSLDLIPPPTVLRVQVGVFERQVAAVVPRLLFKGSKALDMDERVVSRQLLSRVCCARKGMGKRGVGWGGCLPNTRCRVGCGFCVTPLKFTPLSCKPPVLRCSYPNVGGDWPSSSPFRVLGDRVDLQ